MPNLYPAFEVPDLAPTAATAPAPTYGRGWAFDFAKGDFVLDGAGGVVALDGHNAWVQWCVKTVLTQRLAYPIYSNQYGCEVLEAMKSATNRRTAEAEIARTITEALLADARTAAVRDFQVTWEGDQVRVSCTVEPVIGSAERLEVTLYG